MIGFGRRRTKCLVVICGAVQQKMSHPSSIQELPSDKAMAVGKLVVRLTLHRRFQTPQSGSGDVIKQHRSKHLKNDTTQST